jgi:hypothetical protein
MPFDFKLDPLTNDLDLSTGSPVFEITRENLVRQRLEASLALISGEWFLDLTEGTDWLRVVGEKPNERIARDVVTERALQDPDVSSARATATIDRTARSVEIALFATLSDGTEIEVSTLVDIG